MKNDGTAAERAFIKHWEAVGHIERLRDKKDLMGLNKGARLADFAKPSDFLVSAPNVPLHFAEVKSTTNGLGFAFGKIQAGQSKAALLEAKRGSQAYFFYIFSYATGLWYIMPAVQYAEICDSGRRSVKFKELYEWQK